MYMTIQQADALRATAGFSHTSRSARYKTAHKRASILLIVFSELKFDRFIATVIIPCRQKAGCG